MTEEEICLWMEHALRLAEEADARDEVPVGAVLVFDGKLIGEGANRREERNRVEAHAEIIALENYGERTGEWRLPVGTSIVTTTEPCLMCTGALLWARVSHVYYGCADTKNAGLRNLLPQIESGIFDHRFSVRGGYLADRCAGGMSAFFRKKRAAPEPVFASRDGASKVKKVRRGNPTDEAPQF